MTTQPITASLSKSNVAEAKRRAGERGLSRYLDEALARQLQFDRLSDLEEELTAQYGPIPDDVRARVDAMEWPR